MREHLSLDQEMEDRSERKRQLNREIVRLKDNLKMLKKQQQIPEIVAEISKQEAELAEAEQQLVLLEQVKY